MADESPTNPILPTGFFWGATYPFEALGLIGRSPQFWGYILIPILLNLVTGILLYVGILIPGLQGIDALLLNLPNWAVWLGAILRVLLAGGLLLVVGFLLVRFGVVLGAPWYGKLSEEIEHHRSGQLPPAEPARLSAIFRDIYRALLFELKKLLLFGVVTLLLLPLSFFPPIGPIVISIGSVMLSITITCLDFFDPALERRRLKFRAKLGAIRKSLPASGGFGLVCLGLVSIPIVNLLTIPICIVGGTLFFCDRIRPRLPSS